MRFVLALSLALASCAPTQQEGAELELTYYYLKF